MDRPRVSYHFPIVPSLHRLFSHADIHHPRSVPIHTIIAIIKILMASTNITNAGKNHSLFRCQTKPRCHELTSTMPAPALPCVECFKLFIWTPVIVCTPSGQCAFCTRCVDAGDHCRPVRAPHEDFQSWLMKSLVPPQLSDARPWACESRRIAGQRRRSRRGPTHLLATLP